MIVLPNMGLVKWDSINDYFSHEQLAANFQSLDEHNHTAGKGKQIPAGGLAENSVEPKNLSSSVYTQIGENLGNESILTANLKNAAVTSRKFKPTSGLLQLSETKTLTESLVDMPGLKLEITPEVASILLVTLTATFQIPNSTVARAVLVVDGVEQEDAAEWIGNSTFGGNFPMATQVYRIALTAAAHTIKVQAHKSAAGGETKMLKRGGIAGGGGSSMLYLMHAS